LAKDGKTEHATPRKRQLEREKGNIARSKEMATFLTLLSFALVLFVFGGKMAKDMVNLVQSMYNMIMTGTSAPNLIVEGFKQVAIILVPTIIIGTFFHIVNYVIQVRFLFSFKIMKPNFKKIINFKGYFSELFTRKKVIDILRNFAMLILFVVIAYYVLKGKVSLLAGSIWLPWNQSLLNIVQTYKLAFLSLLALLFFIAVVDIFYQKWEHEQKIKMKKQEVKDEAKNNEGSPEVKGRRKELMYALLQQDITNKIPEATVIINNPTHISVALRYKKGEDDLPIVIAKGEEQLALYIRTIAKEKKIPMVENKPLARALYFNVDVNNPIQEEMFEAVALILRQLIDRNEITL